MESLDRIDGFEMRRTDETGEVLTFSFSAETRGSLDKQVVPGRTYTYALSTIVGARQSSLLSVTVTAVDTRLKSPVKLLAATEAGLIRLTWAMDPSEKAEGFELVRKNPDGGAPVIKLPFHARSYSDQDVETGSTYVYNLYAIREGEKSEPATVKVTVLGKLTQNPRIVKQTDSLKVSRGDSVELYVAVEGTPPMQYQWYLNGERLADADQPTLTFKPFVTRAHAGHYVLRVQNSEGLAFSDPIPVSLDWPILDGGDDFKDATPIEGRSGFIHTNNTQATREAGEPRHANKHGGRSIWYAWKPDASGLATLSLQGSSMDTLLAVYKGSSLKQLTEIQSDDDRAGYGTSPLRFSAEAGVAYLIAIDGFDGAGGNMLFSWELDPEQTVRFPRIRILPKKNSVDLGEPYSFSASIDGDVRNLAMQWYHNGVAIPGATGVRYDIASVQRHHAGAYWVEFATGAEVSRTPPADLTVNVPRRGKIVRELVMEDKFADLFHEVQSSKKAPLFQPQSAGASFLPSAVSLARGFTGAQIFHTYGARKEAGEPDHCGLPGGASQWFAYEAPADGVLSITTDGSDIDTILAVYTSTGSRFEDLTVVTCDDNGGMDGQDSTVSFSVRSGLLYYIAIDGFKGATGTVSMAYELAVELSLHNLSFNEHRLQFEVRTIPDIHLVIEQTQDFQTWEEAVRTDSGNGYYLFQEEGALNQERRFYRVYVAE